MTIEQEMTSVLFLKETIEKAKNQFKNGPEIIPLEVSDMTFRLFKATDFNVNLEALIEMRIENTGEEIDVSALGKGVKGTMHKFVMFFKPIGFYTLNDGNIEITIVNEYEKEMNFLIENKKITPSVKVNKLSFRENALIGAFSKETRLEAFKNIDRSFISNGLMLDIYMTNVGYPEVFLDDKYEVEGAIAIYRLHDKPWGIDPVVNYKEIFDKLWSMKLLTAAGKDV
ncbi:MAG: hypothetical protein EPN85_15135 [Bacteroidetes bacterium]|nr:MAG: hypothetical protein EPN85_15135 [Bacteroidota bacterium]